MHIVNFILDLFMAKILFIWAYLSILNPKLTKGKRFYL